MRFSILIIILFCGNSVFSQQQNPVFITYTSENGLSQTDVNNVSLDWKGNLWIASNYGLNKFDGDKFTYYQIPADNNINGIGGNLVKQVICDSTLVWAAVFNAGVSCYYDIAGYFINYIHNPLEVNSLISNEVNCIALARNKTILIGTNGGLSIFDRLKSSFTNIANHPATKKTLKITSLTESDEGLIWVGTDRQGLLYVDKAKQIHAINNLPASLETSTINALFYNNEDKELWIASTAGLWILKKEKQNFNFKQPINELRTTTINCITKRHNKIWIGTDKDGLYHINNNNIIAHITADIIHSEKGLASNNIRDIIWSPDNTGWITTSKGLQYYHPGLQHFSLLKTSINHNGKIKETIPSGLCIWKKYLITATESGVILADTNFLNSTSFSLLDEKNNLVRFKNISLINNDIFLTGSNGLYQLTIDNDKPKIVRPTSFRSFNQYINKPCTDFIEARENIYWLATQNNIIYSFNTINGKVESINPFRVPQRANDIDNKITKVYKDASGRILVGLSSGIAIYEPSEDKLKFTRKNSTPLDATPGLYVNDFYDDGNNIWIASSGKGVYKCSHSLDVISTYNTSNGLCDNIVYCIQPDAKGNIWFSTKRGLSTFDIGSKKISNYYQSDGLASQEFKPYGKALNKNTIYFSSSEGIIKTNPESWENFVNNTFPPTVSKMKIDDESLTEIDLLLLNMMKNYSVEYNKSIVLSFKSNGLYNQMKDSIQYRLNENNNWNTIASGTEILLQKLNPGVYNLQAFVKNKSMGQKELLSFKLDIKPLWYQQVWFYILLIASITAMLYLLYKFRLRQQLRLFEVRDRISRDLHDEVGSTLSGLSMYSRLTKHQVETHQTDEVGKSLDIMQNAANIMINKLSDIVWLVNPAYDSLFLLVQKLEEYSSEMAGASSIKIKTTISPSLKNIKLKMNQRRNIFLLCKEAINNAIKYSEATLLEINMSLKENFLSITVMDNGKGFNPQEIVKGNGLKNIQKRADEMGAKSSFVSSPGEGTKINILCKITRSGIAYSKF